MNTEALKELLVNSQRRRFERAAKDFSENASKPWYRYNLDTAASALSFISNMDVADIEDQDFNETPIGKINEQIDELCKAAE